MKKIVLVVLVVIMMILMSQLAMAKSLDEDKVLHFSAGALIYSTTDYFYAENPLKYVVMGAVTKELYDFYKDGTVDIEDVGWTIAGGIISDWFTIKF